MRDVNLGKTVDYLFQSSFSDSRPLERIHCDLWELLDVLVILL